MSAKTHMVLSAFITFALLPIPALSDDFARITTKQQYLDLVAGKRWYLGDGYALSRRNGRMTCEFGGEKLKGAWAWRGDMWCRTLQTHAKNTDCLALSINGNKLRSIREQGAGDTLIFINK